MARSRETGGGIARPEPRTTPPLAEALSRRVVVERIRPEIDGGRFPIKRTVGETVDVTATVFADGHDVLVAMLRDRHIQGSVGSVGSVGSAGSIGSRSNSANLANSANPANPANLANPANPANPVWRETPMTMTVPGTDQWRASFDVTAIGWHEYDIVSWVDRFLTWRRDLRAKAAAQQDVGVELLEGSLIVREAAARAGQIGPGGPDAARLLEFADRFSDSTPSTDRVSMAADEEFGSLMLRYADRSRATTSAARRVWVDRERARFGAWYEMFPRSSGPHPTRSGTFRDAAADLARIGDPGLG